MSDKVRVAIFDVLGDISGLSVLDAYAGSGAAGLEALSRGAGNVVAIESARSALEAIRRNQGALGVAWGFTVIASTVETWAAKPENDGLMFDIIIADPPYARLDIDVLEKLSRHLKERGIMVISHYKTIKLDAIGNLTKTVEKRYGDSSVTMFQ